MIFAELSGMREELVALESGNLGRVTVGAIPALASSLLTRTIATLKQSHPRLSMSIQVDTSDVLVQALQQDQLDVVLGRIPSGARTDDLVFDSPARKNSAWWSARRTRCRRHASWTGASCRS